MNVFLIIVSILLIASMYFIFDFLTDEAMYLSWLDNWTDRHFRIKQHYLLLSIEDSIDYGFIGSFNHVTYAICCFVKTLGSIWLISLSLVAALLQSLQALHINVLGQAGFTLIFGISVGLYALVVLFVLFKLIKFSAEHQLTKLVSLFDFYVPQGDLLGCFGGLGAALYEDIKDPISQMLKLTGRELSFCLADLKAQTNLMARLKIANKILKRKNIGELIESNEELKQEFIQLHNDLDKQIQHSLDMVDRYDEKCEKIRTAKLEQQGSLLAKQLRGLK